MQNIAFTKSCETKTKKNAQSTAGILVGSFSQLTLQ